MPREDYYHDVENPRPHPLRGSYPPGPPFEPLKISISASLGLTYVDPSHIWSPPVDVDYYDPETGERTEYSWYENVVEGVEAYAAGTADMLQKTGSKPIVGLVSTNLPGAVTGKLVPGFLEYIPS